MFKFSDTIIEFISFFPSKSSCRYENSYKNVHCSTIVMGNIRNNVSGHSGECDFINDIRSFKGILKENEEAVSANTHWERKKKI